MELECEGERVESIVLYGNKGTVWIAIANGRRSGVAGVRVRETLSGEATHVPYLIRGVGKTTRD